MPDDSPSKLNGSRASQNGNGTYRADDTFEQGVSQQMRVREWVAQYMDIHAMQHFDEADLPTEDRMILNRGDSCLVASFTGTLKGQSEAVYDALDDTLAQADMFPLLRPNESADNADAPHVVHVADMRPRKPDAGSPWLNILLFVLTVFSVLLTGATIWLGQQAFYLDQQQQGVSDVPALSEERIALVQDWERANSAADGGFWESVGVLLQNLHRGVPYAAAIMLILVPHEMGHYLMMRRQDIVATLPYFLPAPLISPFGTFGAAISLRESLKNRRKLLDVGAAGPLAGFVFAVPILFIGLATSSTTAVTEGGFVEGNSLLYAFAKLLIFGEVLPANGTDVLLNQLAWAGWTGLFITALNMIPLGQLDGGHVLYSLLGEPARKLYMPLMVIMVLMTLFVSSVWLLIAVMLAITGRFYAVPLDTITPLDSTRRTIGIVALVIFVLSFTPVPLYVRGESGGLLTGMIGIVVSMALLRQWITARRSTAL